MPENEGTWMRLVLKSKDDPVTERNMDEYAVG